jgi:hypothetical protein
VTVFTEVAAGSCRFAVAVSSEGPGAACRGAAAVNSIARIAGAFRNNVIAIPADRTAIHAVVADITFIRSFSVYDGEAAERNNAFADECLHSVPCRFEK